MDKIENRYYEDLNRCEVDIMSNIPFDKIELQKICDKNDFTVPTKSWFDERRKHNYKCKTSSGWGKYSLEDMQKKKYDGFNADNATKRICNIYYDNDRPKYCVRYTTDKYILNKITNKDVNPKKAKKIPYCIDEENNIVIHSKIKSKYIENNDNFPKTYYWKTPDGWLYLHDENREKNGVGTIKITSPIINDEDDDNDDNDNKISQKKTTKKNNSDSVINNEYYAKMFFRMCFRVTKQKKLRASSKDVMIRYEKWCKETNNKKTMTQCILEKEIKKSGRKKEYEKGVDINGNENVIGYNIKLI
jgi:hypothetical protein